MNRAKLIFAARMTAVALAFGITAMASGQAVACDYRTCKAICAGLYGQGTEAFYDCMEGCINNPCVYSPPAR